MRRSSNSQQQSVYSQVKQTTHSLTGQTGGTNSIINKPNSMTGLNAKTTSVHFIKAMVNVTVFKTCLKIQLSVTLTH